jgi:hypothetical protein
MFGINQLVRVPEHSYGWLGAAGLSHVQAQAMIASAFMSQLGRASQGHEALFAQAVSLCETGYGASWKDEGVGSNNMGAVQAGKPPCDPAIAFPYGDTHEDGQAYAACFRKYATPQEGFNGLIRVLYKQRPKVFEVSRSGSIRDFSTELRASGYFELGLEKHIKALTKCLNTVSSATGQPMPAAGRAPATASNWLGPIAVLGVAGWIFWKVVKK